MEQQLSRPALQLGSPVKLVIGLFFAAMGILWTLDNLGVEGVHEYLHYWPLVLIVIGALKLKDPTARGVATALIVAGSLLLVWSVSSLSFSVFALWPLILIAAGVFLVLQALGLRGPSLAGPSSPGTMRVATVLGNRQEVVTASDFRGGRAAAFLSSCEIDLRDADIDQGPAVIEVLAMMASVEITVPEGWEVVSDVLPLMGGVEVKLRSNSRPTRRLIVRGFVLMGGVEIRDVPRPR